VIGHGLIVELRERHIRLSANGDRLVVEAPRGVLTAELCETLRRHKADLLALLTVVANPRTLTPADLPSDWRLEWEERAAIREYEGGQAREHAEAEAFAEILARIRASQQDSPAGRYRI